jgi:predicted nucleic-acid-binding protein
LIRSIDTNLLVRLIVRDDMQQVAIAQRIFSGRVLLLPTVIQETVWILSRGYKVSSQEIVLQISELLSLSNVALADEMACLWALNRYAIGADFADMLHLALSGAADMFTTFDRGISRYADDQVIPVETLGLA